MTLLLVATIHYLPPMTDDTEGTYDKPRQIRVPDDEWIPFEAATKAAHPTGRSPRARVVREFIRWYMRRPGAKLPARPPAGPWSEPPSGS
ncbi:hypothetical protein GKJPGBOP_00480 [Streptomyces paromomycinus]|uniref:Uncharacterized protein n=2 Tax=Streptomyces paromomycinus TaxID=92743 RepID=A0A401VUS2_STREY|nr:hypothetical protein GKJPGBOP_00480 [Streptomyces paromomycinus]